MRTSSSLWVSSATWEDAAGFEGEETEADILRLLSFAFMGDLDVVAVDTGFVFCFANMASIPSFLFSIGCIKVEDSVPTLPTSFGTL